ncbi:FAD-binding oxidoreductase [Aliifodinibius sp. S!AR15-10]|uniref:FAD-binding oxidoreductase n=1 Tax=Aliifodinibius sp. S!AR15-10 TaxID=2950437 RepID=UPI0028553F1A|nr:FAD-binding oxidoreductase [Aliifodinibius sp. S!AR15-10]MDR8392404.1 FAD-binding oxidoreductase [Aliifodinibius sp. S!AR15-10]
MAEQSVYDEFSNNLRGSLVRPGDKEYDESRSVYNGMIDRKPKCIAYCHNVADVITAVRFARKENLRLAIRGGGHNAAGLGVCDDGLVIDLSNINLTYVDPKEKTVRVGGGATWGDVDHATHAFGLATPSGIVSTTGVGGLTLGGGLGHLTRTYGLTIDNLQEANLVLSDGSFVTVSKDQHPDLFWAIRGGGGNFGVVTSFKFRLHEVSTVYAGPTFWEMDEAEEIMHWYREFILDAPNEINGFFAIQVIPPVPPFPEHLHNKTMCGVLWCYPGSLDKAEEVFEPIRKVGNIALDMVGPLPYPALQSMFDELYPAGLYSYWKADYLTRWSDEAIKKNIEYGSRIPTPLSGMHLYPVNGAAHEVGNDETAWSYRDANWVENIVGFDPDPANKRKFTDWAREYWEEAVHPYTAGGAYVNFMMDEGEDRVKATYKNNYERLAKIKAKYDPDNFFNVNQNIKPNSSTYPKAAE